MVAQKRMLVVDDEPTVRESFRRIFGERGYEVDAVATGGEGLERARVGYYDCAVVDIRMPDMDGMEVVRRARKERGNMAVLVVTGYAAVDTAAEALRLGASDYVRKPFTPDEIVQAVERALSAPPSAHALDGVERLADKLEKATPVAEHFENRTPAAVTRMVMKSVGVNKARAPLASVTVLGVLAGVYIGFGAAMATLVGHDAAKYIGVGLAQVFTGAVFSVGLMLVVLAGAELFTGNNLMVVSVLGREYGWGRMLGRWALVYAANFAGSVLLAWLMFRSGLWKTASNAVGARALAIANAKVSLPFEEAFFRGIGCNWLVCLAVWMALSSKDVAGKILAVFFPIMAFVALGFEHCVANMYFVPLGIFLKGSAVVSGLDVQPLTWGRFLVANLVPVTLGNVVGGGLFVGALYWFSYARGGPAPKPASSN